MNFTDLVARRRSIREYADRDVEDDKLRQVLECARAAPSAGNLQAYRILVVRNAETRRALARAALDQEFVAEAPVVLVFYQDPKCSAGRYGGRGTHLYSIQDATIACAYAQLGATELGLASCWVGAFDTARVSKILGARRGLRPVALLPLGHAAEKPARVERRPLGDLVEWDRP